MAVLADCRHYSSRTTPAGVVERCRMDMAQSVPFECPENCIFYEPRNVTSHGWDKGDGEDGKAGGLYRS